MKVNRTLLLYSLIVVLFFMLLQKCTDQNEIYASLKSSQAFLNDTIAYYENEIGQQVAERKAIQGNTDVLEVLLSKQIDSTGQLKRLVSKYKNLAAAGNITQETIIDTVEIPYEVAVPYEFTRDFSKQTDNYLISGTSRQKGVTLSEIQIPNTLSFAIGKKRTGLFKSEYRIEVVNSNPYIYTTGLDSYTLEVPAKRLGLSLYAGYGVGSNLTLQPSAGVALTYTFIKF